MYVRFGASSEPGGADVEDIVCPSGWEVVVDSAGNPKCDNGTGGQIPPIFRPSTKLVSDTAMGLLEWSFVAAGVMVVASLLIRPSRGRS